jgi:hypothetical protein
MADLWGLPVVESRLVPRGTVYLVRPGTVRWLPGDEEQPLGDVRTLDSSTTTVEFTLAYVNRELLALLYGAPMRHLWPRGRAMRAAYRAKTRRRNRRRR